MKINEFAKLLIKRHEKCLSSNIMVVGSDGYGLDNLCVSIAEIISSRSKKINFKDKHYIRGDISYPHFNKSKDSIIIQVPNRCGILSEINIHKQVSLNLQISRHLNNIFILRDMIGLSKSSLVRLFDFKISVSFEGDIYLENISNKEICKIDYDLRQQNDRAERLRLNSLNKLFALEVDDE